MAIDTPKVTGTKAGEVINGTANNDTIDALGGNDTVNGNGGNDKLYGGTGSDKLSGGAGNDTLMGGKGVDMLYGGAGNDTFAFGKSDFDTSLGGKPQDFVWDFEGADGAGGDFLRFTGFGANSTLTLNTDKQTNIALDKYNPGLKYYTLTDSNDNATYTIAIKTVGTGAGETLSALHDYHFYV